MRKLLTYGLLALAFVGAGYAVKQRLAPPATAAAAPSVELPDTSLPANGTVVTYFTTNVRCPSCRKIEELTRQAVENRFPEQVASGSLVFRTVNTDESENKHFVDDYQLVSKTVVVAKRKDGKEIGWENLQDIWLKLSSPDDFDSYVTTAIQESLKPSGS